MGISTAAGDNVVTMGEALERRMAELMGQIPLGIEFGIISLQSESVQVSVQGFVSSLLQAIAIVVVVLLLFMGLRSGLLIGFVLFLTIAASFVFMSAAGVTLERISLGALIIALGMLVDNAIESYVRSLDGITHVTSIIGQGAPRFLLTYVPEKQNSDYAQLLVDVDDYRSIDAKTREITAEFYARMDRVAQRYAVSSVFARDEVLPYLGSGTDHFYAPDSTKLIRMYDIHMRELEVVLGYVEETVELGHTIQAHALFQRD